MPVDETAEFQKIIGAKRRSASRDVTEGILRRQIRHVAHCDSDSSLAHPDARLASRPPGIAGRH